MSNWEKLFWLIALEATIRQDSYGDHNKCGICKAERIARRTLAHDRYTYFEEGCSFCICHVLFHQGCDFIVKRDFTNHHKVRVVVKVLMYAVLDA